jgi:hypothetical protein
VDVDVPLGLGSRHVAAASISKELGICAVVVSQSGVVRALYQVWAGGCENSHSALYAISMTTLLRR